MSAARHKIYIYQAHSLHASAVPSGTYAVLIFVMMAKFDLVLLEDLFFKAAYETFALHCFLLATQIGQGKNRGKL